MRLAHVVLAHSRPGQLAALAARLAAHGDLVLLHVDRRRPLRPFVVAMRDAGVDPEALVVLPRFASPWGGFGLVQAALAGLQRALEVRPHVGYVGLHSGQDLPIVSRDAMVERLAGADGRAFVKHLRYPAEDFPDAGGMDRFRRWYVRPSRRWSVPNRFVRFVPERAVPAGLEPHGGSQFFWLPRDVAAEVLDLTARRPELLRFFRRSFVPDETYVPTLVMSGPLRERVVDDDLHYVDHPSWAAHPRTLDASDLPALRSSGDLLARKFDLERDPELLAALDVLRGGDAGR